MFDFVDTLCLFNGQDGFTRVISTLAKVTKTMGRIYLVKKYVREITIFYTEIIIKIVDL